MYSWWVNNIFLDRSARKVLRKRLIQNSPQHSPESLIAHYIPSNDQKKAYLLLEEISETLSIHTHSLIFDSKLKDVLRISSSELKINNWPKDKLVPEYVEPFTYDLLLVLQKICSTKLWAERLKSHPRLPQNEEDIADFVMEMTPAGFLIFFSPLIANETALRKWNKR